ncbi:hypothetical protein GS928_24990 [Rhodococcus hoagii]|nr:hypothetical protein [Prescottella equi]
MPGREGGPSRGQRTAAKPATAADIKKLDGALTNAGSSTRRSVARSSPVVSAASSSRARDDPDEVAAVIDFIENGEPVADDTQR